MVLSESAGADAFLAPDDEASWARVARHWSFAPGITFLNHGSFGSAPAPVLEARQELLARLNRDPVDFYLRFVQPRLADARAVLGRFLNTSGDDLALVENATVAMNAVARSVRLSPGDEVLTTDHEYGAVMRIWQLTCEQAGARLIVVKLPCPFSNIQACVDAIFTAASPRTRLLVFSHVTSPTAVTLPAAAICQRARERGIPTAIDGPHALVATPLDLAAIDCDYYTASCHKWLLTPVGCGMLYVHPRAQADIRPAVISWGRTLGHEKAPSWRDEFNWSGTRDPTPCLCIPAAVEFLESIGVDAFRARTHYLARLARQKIGAWTGMPPLVPDDPAWYGSMISLPVPADEAQWLQDALWERFQIEAPVFDWQGQKLVRVSCQMYTKPSDIDRLATALGQLLVIEAKDGP